MFVGGRCTPAILLTMSVMSSAAGTTIAKSIAAAASRFQNPTTTPHGLGATRRRALARARNAVVGATSGAALGE